MIAAVSGILLFIFMFFDWYGVSVEGAPGFDASAGGSAWAAFGFIDILLFLAAAIAVAVAVVRALGAMPNLPAPAGQIVFIAGVVAVLLVIFRIIFTPGTEDTGVPGVEIEITRRIGVFLGLIASAGIAFGGFTAMNERTSGTVPGATPTSTGGPPPGGPGGGATA